MLNSIKNSTQKLRLFAPACIFIILFFIPGLAGLEALLYDDIAKEFFPRQLAMARIFQAGEVPFWDQLRFNGALPFYVDLENSLYNLFLLPFYFLPDLTDLDQSFIFLYLLPFCISSIISAYFSFLWIRECFSTSITTASLYALTTVFSVVTLSDGFLYQSYGYFFHSTSALIYFTSQYFIKPLASKARLFLFYLCATRSYVAQ